MHIGIVGAGIMGRLLAYTFLNNGHQVSIYDQDADTGNSSCSMAAAGMLAPVSELAKSDELIYKLGLEAIDVHWPNIMNGIRQDVYFIKTGSLVLSHPKDHCELLNLISMIDSKLENKKTSLVYKQLNKDELHAYEPQLSKFNNTYYFPAEGQLDNQALMAALKKCLYQQNVRWYANTYVTEIVANKIITANDTSQYEIVFDCRGMGATSVFNDLHAVRGEIIWLHAPDVCIQRPIRFMHPRYSLYIVPRPNNIYVVGASEIYANDYSSISVRSTLELLTTVYYVHSAFAEARILKTVTHCRPTLSHHLPRIKCSHGNVAVNGLYRHGFLIAPTLAAEIAAWLDKGKSSLKYPQIWEFS